MKIADVRAKTQDQLKQELLTLSKERFNLRFQRSTAQLENTARVRLVRRDIARIKTVLAEQATGKTPTAKAAPKKAAARRTKKESKE